MGGGGPKKWEVDSTAVVRMVLQYLRENNLKQTAQSLQEETGVFLNTVDSVEVFAKDVVAGNWDRVLAAVQMLQLPEELLLDLYEHVVLELAEMREVETAKALLRDSAPLNLLRTNQPARYLRLGHLVNAPFFDAREAFPTGRDNTRRTLAAALLQHVSVAEPARLLSIVWQSMKYQQHAGLLPPGTAYDPFRGGAPLVADAGDKWTGREFKRIKFPKKSHAESVLFTADGQYLITGSADGFIEVWDFETAKLNKELEFQAKEEPMMMDDAVLCLATSPDDALLVSGARDGRIKVWQLETGKCLRRMDAAHTKGVATVGFMNDVSQVFSCSFDTTVRIHGLKSGKTLREFRGHTSFVNMCLQTPDTTQLVSASSDGSVRLWDVQSTECRKVHKLPQSTHGLEIAVNSIALVGMNRDRLLCCNRSPVLYVLDLLSGDVVSKFSVEDQDLGSADFTYAFMSPKEEYVYATREDNMLFAFNFTTGELVGHVHVHDGEVLGAATHPHRNLVATISDEGLLKLWWP